MKEIGICTHRYYFSTIAYQGARGLDAKSIRQQNEKIAPTPDLLVYLDIPASTAIERIRKRDGIEANNHFEREEDLEKARKIFLTFDMPFLVSLNGETTRESLHLAILQTLDSGPLFRGLCHKDYLERCEPEYCSYRLSRVCAYPDVEMPRSHQQITEELRAATSLKPSALRAFVDSGLTASGRDE